MEAHESNLLLAAKLAERSLCLRSRCGAFISQGAMTLGAGFNGPPQNDPKHRRCGQVEPSRLKPKSDRTCCLHAEWRALASAQQHVEVLPGAILYFARVDERGVLQKSGRPYCTVCSRLALDAGIASWVLWHDDGIRVYDAAEYNDLSHQYDELERP